MELKPDGRKLEINAAAVVVRAGPFGDTGWDSSDVMKISMKKKYNTNGIYKLNSGFCSSLIQMHILNFNTLFVL